MFAIKLPLNSEVRWQRVSAKVVTLSFIFVSSVILDSAALAQESDLGRVFYTPRQRAALDQIRLMPPELTASEELYEELREEEEDEDDLLEESVIGEYVAPDIYLIEGIMRVADGRHSLWMNGEVYDHLSLPDNVSLVEPFGIGGVKVTSDVDGTEYLLRTGQALNILTGEIFESFKLPTTLFSENLDEGGTEASTDELATIDDLQERDSEQSVDTFQEADALIDTFDPRNPASDLSDAVELLNDVQSLRGALQ